MSSEGPQSSQPPGATVHDVLSRAIENSANSVLLIDSGGAILWANPSFTRLTGYSLPEVAGIPRESWSCDWQPPAIFPDVWQKMCAGHAFTGRAWNRRKDGSTYFEETTITPICDAAGSISHFLTVQREAVPGPEPAQLFDRGPDSNLEAQLRRAQKMEAVGQLAGGAAHDFNNLLTVINGYSDLLLSRNEPPESAHRYLQMIRDAGERATTLAARLLTFSRGKAEETTIVNLNDLVTEMSTLLRRLLPSNIQLIHKLEPHLDMVLVDAGLMEQVLMNLVINARDAMREGGKIVMETLNVEAGVTAVPRRSAVLTVTDTGVGMDESIKAHLFEPFFTTKPAGLGTGLGLCTVNRIVKQSSGWMSVQSEPGKGTSVSVYLPSASGAPELGAPVRPAAAERGSGTILLVDDSPGVLGFAAYALEDLGYTVLQASNGQDAVEWATNFDNPIDLLLTDIVLPDANGRELAEKLTSMRPGLAVLFTSGYPRDPSAGEAPEFLAKPFTADDLAVHVQDVLRKRYHRRILIIDDDPALLALARLTLDGAGFEVWTAENGGGATALVRDRRIDLVITDIIMPEIEGLETIRSLRLEYPSLPIIAISGAFGGQFLKHALRFGVKAVIRKPFSAVDLIDAVRRTLGIGARLVSSPGAGA